MFNFVDFRQDCEALLNVEQRTDVEMLTRLGHHRFVSGYNEHDQVSASNAGKHVLDEALVAGNIDKTDGRFGIQSKMCEPDIDCDSALFLFFQAIGVNSCQRLDERSFAVVDVPGGSYDNVRH